MRVIVDLDKFHTRWGKGAWLALIALANLSLLYWASEALLGWPVGHPVRGNAGWAILLFLGVPGIYLAYQAQRGVNT